MMRWWWWVAPDSTQKADRDGNFEVANNRLDKRDLKPYHRYSRIFNVKNE